MQLPPKEELEDAIVNKTFKIWQEKGGDQNPSRAHKCHLRDDRTEFPNLNEKNRISQRLRSQCSIRERECGQNDIYKGINI